MASPYQYDHAWLERVIDDEIAAAPGKPVGVAIAWAVTKEIERLAAAGDDKAPMLVRAALANWLINRVESRLKANTLAIPVSWNGQIVAVPVPARLGVRTTLKGADGKSTTVTQYPLWTYESWEVVEQLIAKKETSRDGLDRDIAAMRKVLALRTKYPNSTPHEAAVLEGLDPLTFEKPAI